MATSKQDWIARCRERCVSHGGLTEPHAADLANWCWENRLKGEGPEAAADEDMKHWDT